MSLQGLTISERNIKIGYFTKFFGALFFLIPVWTAFELQYITYSQMAMVEMVMFGSQLILELPTGALADMLGRKITIFSGLLLTGLSLILFSYSDSFADFLLFAVLYGLGEALVSGSGEALFYDSLKQDNKESLYDKVASRFGFIVQGGLALATLLGGFFSLYNMRLPSLLNAGFVILAAFLSLLLIEPSIDSEKFSLHSYIKQTKTGFAELFRNSYITKLSFFYGIIGGITWAIAIFLSKIVMLNIGLNLTQMGMFFSTARVSNALVVYLLVNKTTFATRKNTFLAFSFILPLILIPAYFGGAFFSVIAIIGAMFFGSARHSILGMYTNQEFSSKNRSTAISALSMIVGFMYMASVGIAGPIIEKVGDPTIMISALGVFLALTVLPIGVQLIRNGKQ